MSKKYVILLLSALAFWGAYKVAIILTPPPIPELDENAYWGPGVPKPDDTTIKPFKINVPEQVIEDLNRRLDQTKDLVAPLEGIQFQYGFNTNTLKNILTYWRKEYKWREREQFLNQFPQFKTQIQGLDIHFIHIKPKLTNGAKKTLPLLLLHGWPGSVREFYSLIPLLTTKPQEGADFVFELVVPSLPGYGFSQGASRPGLGAAEMGVVFKNLMKRLGHDKFYTQGGDWGALITESIATIFPGNVLGLHSTMCGAQSPMVTMKMFVGSFLPSLVIDEKYQDRLYPLGKTFSFLLEETGYMHLQASKPDTVGVALSDSPAGLAAYILEKFITWTEPKWKATPDGSLTKKFTYTDLLDNVMIYWVSNSITTSMRLYAESFSKRHMSLQISSIPTNVPAACARFKNELLYMPDSFLKEKYTNLIQTSDFDDGGHFAAFELPNVLAKDVWSAFVKITSKKPVIQDLNNRLDNTKDLAPPLEGVQFEYGFNTNTLKNILTFWRKEYKWRDREQFLNQYPQFKTQIQGLDIHFIHVKPKAKRTIPLLLMHGWPGSIREFYSLIPMLTSKPQGADFVFELVIPSLPGYGFSQGASKPGLGAVEIGILFKNLMKRLGHDKFYIQGGDWGSIIGSSMVTLFPNSVLGMHSNMCTENSGQSFGKLFLGSVFPSTVAPEEHQHRLYPLSNLFSFILEEFGYSHIQATKPDTIGVALTDSPAGLAAYILEKFSTWTNPNWKHELDGGLTKKYTYTDLLDNIMIYWITGSATTSMRLYAETINARNSNMQLTDIPTSVPIACARFRNELIYQPDSLLTHKYKNLIRSIDFSDGGHFAAFEVPKILADDVWSAIIKIETNTKK